MRAFLEYQSTTWGDCPSDYDFSKIEDSAELKFLKWTDTLQSVITRLKYNIDMFEYFTPLYLLNRVIKDELKGFFTMYLSNLSMLIAIDFSSLIAEKNDLKLALYRKFCMDNSTLFKNGNMEDILKKAKADFKQANNIYKEYFETPRNKYFAHIGEPLLDRVVVDKDLQRVRTSTMKKLLQFLMNFLNGFWEAYNGHKLCFTLKNGDDYKKLADSVCEHLGDKSFLHLF